MLPHSVISRRAPPAPNDFCQRTTSSPDLKIPRLRQRLKQPKTIPRSGERELLQIVARVIWLQREPKNLDSRYVL